MRTRIGIGLLTVAVILAWTGIADAQTALPTPKMQLPTGETVWDLSGDWDAFLENYGARTHYGIYPQVWRIMQTGSTFSCIRVKDNPPPSSAWAGSPCLRGELDKTGFNKVWTVDPGGTPWEGKGQISEDGKKIVIDNERHVRVTLTRSGDRTPLVGLWRLM
jgi:hypothetical protein